MNWGKVLEIGLKVVVALGAGLAVFKGIESATRYNNQDAQVNQQNPNDFSGQGVANDKSAEPSTGSVVISGLQAAQNTCGKLFNIAQGLVTVAQSISAFGGNNGCSTYSYPAYGGYSNYYPPQQCSPGWRRVSPFILEQVPQPGAAINYNAQYPY